MNEEASIEKEKEKKQGKRTNEGANLGELRKEEGRGLGQQTLNKEETLEQ